MFTLKRLIGGSLFVFVLAGTALAQENRAPIDKLREAVAPVPAAPLVTAAARAERVRFMAPSNVVRIKVEVFSPSGDALFDVSSKGKSSIGRFRTVTANASATVLSFAW